MAKKPLKKGIFITFEGPEGCGKSTHAKLIYKFLKRQGFDCIFTREPGGTRAGNKIRNILLSPRYKYINSLTELFLFEANRAFLIEEVILPALKKKKIIICDRFNDSTIVYQGYASELALRDVIKIDSMTTHSVRPDLTILLDIDASTGLKRALRYRRKDRMESKSLTYHRRVRNGYRDLARKNKKRIRLIRVREKLEKTQSLVKKEIIKLLKRYTKCHLEV